MVEEVTQKIAYKPNRNLDKLTLNERVYQLLREDILSNRLPPGAPLHEEVVAAGFGVSRGPVREALRRLDAEGLVNLVPRRVAVVSSFSREEFLDAYRVREALEVLAVRLATARLNATDISALEQLHEQMVASAAAEDMDGFFSANMAFHALIADRSGNEKLREFYHPLVNQMRRYRVSSVSLRGGLQRSCDEHRRVLDAIRAGAADEAARLLSEHIRVPQRILESDDEVELVPRQYMPVDTDAQ
ncbi:MAG: GntR family transcriptional regulator [Anaerolineales bacterium]